VKRGGDSSDIWKNIDIHNYDEVKTMAEQDTPKVLNEEGQKVVNTIIARVKAENQPAIDALDAKIAAAKEANDTETAAQMTSVKDEFDKRMAVFEKAAIDRKVPSQEEIEEEAEHNPLHHGKFKHIQHFMLDLVKDASGVLTDEMADWKKTVAESGHKGAKQLKATQTVGAMETGGALMPTGFSTEVFERQMKQSPIMSKALVIPMEQIALDIPYVAGFDESQGFYFGNVKWYWKGEAATMTSTNFETGDVNLRLNELTGMVTVTKMLLDHSPTSVKAIIDRAFDKSMGRAITRGCIRGTGAGMPQGVFNAVCEVPIDKETGQAADTITYRNLLDMLAVLYSEDGGMGDGVFYANRTCLPTLGEITISVGTGGKALFLDRVQDRLVAALLGMPLEFNTMMSAVGDAGDIGIFDWTQYIIGQWGSGGVESEASIHLYFDTNKVAFRFVTLFDGRCWWPETFKPEYGDPQSPFVTLAERA